MRHQRLEEILKPVYLSDINGRFVDMAQTNAKKARVEKHMHFATGSIFDCKAPAASGLLIANLPYGERMQDDPDLQDFYRRIGDKLKADFSGWRAALLVSEESPYKFIGLRTTRKFPLLNGKIRCKLLLFDLYSGSKRRSPENSPHHS